MNHPHTAATGLTMTYQHDLIVIRIGALRLLECPIKSPYFISQFESLFLKAADPVKISDALELTIG